MEAKGKGPLAGVRVIEMGQLIAGPFCGKILAEFGAEVIKIELPGKGDPLRVWRTMLDETNTSLWWYIQSRNKKSITLRMGQAGSAEIAKRLIKEADVVIENFKPGTMEKWGLGWDVLHELNPKLIMTRISGWGQTGPYRDKASYGSIGESMGGIRYITGYSDRPPVRSSISLGDSLAAMWGAMGTLMALYNRAANGGQGQIVDIGLNEAVFGLMEAQLLEYDRLGIVRERAGTGMPGISPVNTYTCKDGAYAVVAGNGDGVFKRLMQAIDHPELSDDPRYDNNAKRVANNDYLDEIIGEWVSRHTYDEVVEILTKFDVPVSPIYSIADIAKDPQYIARNLIQTFNIPGAGPIKVPGIVPKLSETPGETEWLGPELGQHNHEIYVDLLGIDEQQLAAWQAEGLI